MNDQQLQAMINQKLKEINEGEIKVDEQELKKCKETITQIKKQFSDIKQNKGLSKFEMETAVKDAVFALASINQELEEHQYLVQRYGEYYKQEREKGKLQVQQLTNFKQLLEENCRKMQADNKKIREGNVSMKEKNDNDRNSIIENCEKSVKEFEDKITEQEVENKKLEEENLSLREDLKQKIQEHEENQKKAEQQRAEKDEQQNESQKQLQEEYNKIEEGAREAIDIQKQNSDSFKMCQEMKVQIVYYRDKIKEFEQSLEKSKEFLDVVIKEIGKLGVKFEPFSQKKKKLEDKAGIGDTIIIQYLNNNTELKNSIAVLSQEKAKKNALFKKIQEEYQQKQKQQQQ